MVRPIHFREIAIYLSVTIHNEMHVDRVWLCKRSLSPSQASPSREVDNDGILDSPLALEVAGSVSVNHIQGSSPQDLDRCHHHIPH